MSFNIVPFVILFIIFAYVLSMRIFGFYFSTGDCFDLFYEVYGDSLDTTIVISYSHSDGDNIFCIYNTTSHTSAFRHLHLGRTRCQKFFKR